MNSDILMIGFGVIFGAGGYYLLKDKTKYVKVLPVVGIILAFIGAII